MPALLSTLPPALLRTLRTISYLKPSQVYWQLLRRLQRTVENPGKLDSLSVQRENWHPTPLVPPFQARSPVPIQSREELLRGEFCFLNHQVQLSCADKWSVAELPKLWQYNLHYFDWLWSFDKSIECDWHEVKKLVIDWIENHPPRKGATGWEPYPSSLRLINWSLLFFGRWRSRTLSDSEFSNRLSESMFRQYQWLNKHLEYHILANHLLENAVALAVGGAFFRGAFAEKISTSGNVLCQRELREQVLPDGLHYERSSMYHARVLWLCEVLQGLGDSQTTSIVNELLPRMYEAMNNMTHADGSLALFNDAANHIYALPKTRHHQSKVWSLPSAGFYGAQSARSVVENHPDVTDSIVCNCGSITPSYQPGHAHADSLAFEWFIEGKPFITNTGIFQYSTGEARNHDRSTAAHNTVQIGDENSSEVWSSFRVGKRAKVRVDRWNPADSGFELCAVHDGYSPWTHRRTFQYDQDRLEIVDQVAGPGTRTVKCFLHFGPDVQIVDNPGECHARIGNAIVRIQIDGCKLDRIWKHTRYSPEFGLSINRQSFVLEANIQQMGQLRVCMKVER